MKRERLAHAWSHIRQAIGVLFNTPKLQTQPQVPVTAENANTDQREALRGELATILDNAEPAGVRISSDKIPGGVRYGTFSRIARELGTTPQAVWRVANARSTSARITEALARYGVIVRKIGGAA